MVCAALGIDRADEKSISRVSKNKMTVVCFGDDNLEKRLIDYQTVSGVPRVDGSKSGPVQLYKEYLIDTSFGIIIEGSEDGLKDYYSALINPKWPMSLGRKCCIPSSIIPQGIFKDIKEAEDKLEKLSGRKIVKRILETSSFDKATSILKKGNTHLVGLLRKLLKYFSPLWKSKFTVLGYSLQSGRVFPTHVGMDLMDWENSATTNFVFLTHVGMDLILIISNYN